MNERGLTVPLNVSKEFIVGVLVGVVYRCKHELVIQ